MQSLIRDISLVFGSQIIFNTSKVIRGFETFEFTSYIFLLFVLGLLDLRLTLVLGVRFEFCVACVLI